MKPTYVFFADGFEEIEALSVVDILRRAEMPVVTVSINATERVTGAHGVVVMADTTIAAINSGEAEWLVCPGGMPGASNLYACEPLRSWLSAQYESGGKVAAICASPAIVLAPMGMLNGRQAVCYPGMETSDEAIQWADGDVAIDGNVTTGNGPASAAEFAFALVEQSMGRDRFLEIGEQMLFA